LKRIHPAVKVAVIYFETLETVFGFYVNDKLAHEFWLNEVPYFTELLKGAII
jgi:hypothetical protein